MQSIKRTCSSTGDGATPTGRVTTKSNSSSGSTSTEAPVDKNACWEYQSGSAVYKALGLVCRSGFDNVGCESTLSLVCVSYCNTLRESLRWKLTIEQSTPARLINVLHPAADAGANEGRCDRVQVPVAIHHLTYDLQDFPTDVVWPRDLRRLSFGDNFNGSIDGVRWPARLEVIWLGQSFNHPVENVEWPSLKQLRFGRAFDQDVERVRWPSGLEQLVFGNQFNRPIAGMKEWPPSLLVLSFGHAFNQGVAGVTLPPRLEFLEFGQDFNHSIDELSLPPTLQHIRFSHKFDQDLDQASWPRSLRTVWLCGTFAQPIRDVVWPAALKVLALPARFGRQGEHEDGDDDDVDQWRAVLPVGCRFQRATCG
ncbi:unnamed protein product [Ectocarpus sp. 6 AP-2014]